MRRILGSLGGTLGRRVRVLRIAAGLSQDQLATLAGVSRTTMSRVERDQHRPHRATLQALAGAMGVDTAALAGDGNDDTPGPADE